MGAEGGKTRRVASGGSADRKRRRAKYLPHNQKKAVISHGQQGFLVTCVGGKERASIQEISNVLDEFFDRPSTLPPLGLPIRIEAEDARGFDDRTGNSGTSEHSEESGDDESDESDDEGARKVSKLAPPAVAPISTEVKSRSGGIDELLAAEIDEIRTKKKARFSGCETGCHGVVFVRMFKDAAAQRSPMELAEAIIRDAAATKKSRTRYSMRLIPVETTCYASAAEVAKAAKAMVARHFPVGEGYPTFKFAVAIEARANTSIDKMELINAVAKIVPQPHSVDLRNPQKTILLQIVKTTCALGIVREFKELAKYNLRMLTNPELEKQPSKEPSLIPGGAPVDPLVRTDTPRINASSAADVTSDKLEDNQDSKNENDSENKQEFKSDEGTLS
ncbi:uncharacterized protein [Physcomitrium patens]|uniref:THUMP domain-containing protein n=1 Tax=Physcomitrium patens TaxID=3218 RepID=A9RBE4_PHYPA|nr:uncharacterized protein LOC112279986 [Physcomitrium patens]PNR56903.1 hypothetical protein PHYPA_003895 [Physcomitrium patens]|eukprot:XP_024370617.1 uncharacterized protein LOC112279986 [Physcomitrella patens]